MPNEIVPQCVGVIMDGNRRWAKERGLPTLEGHRAGLEKLKEVSEWAFAAGVQTVVYYAFSTENWKRSPEEVAYLMGLFDTAIHTELETLRENNIRVRFIGDLSKLSSKLRGDALALQEASKGNTRGTIVVALSYGGRPEILAAVNTLLASGAKSVDEDAFRRAMWSADIPDPDLIIRTSGEQRLSNFLTWQSAYSELFFTETKWPDFSKEELERILADFASRERRHGK